MLLHAKHITLWLLFALMCTSCSGVHDLREARSVVAAADSLRAASGALYNDSTALAFAVTTLEPVRLLFPTDYAHANYYYGRLLREAGDQPEAMLAFLRAVHSRTKDHAIKGRSYCNMGIMCGWATYHELAYDMYERSADEFLLASDTTAYYYALIDMAFARAEGLQKDEAIRLTNQIERECKNYGVLTKIWETRACAYLRSKMYDSTLYSVNHFLSINRNEPTGLLIKAKAFSLLSVKDSAVYYAKQVAEKTNSWFDMDNTYYILLNDDIGKSKEEGLQVAADRSDVQKLIGIRHGHLTQAVLLLQQDLSRKPDLTWLWTLLATLTVVGIFLSIYIQKQKSKRQLISQQVEDLQHKQDVLSEQNLQLEQQYTLRQEKAMKEMEEFCHSITTDNIHKTLSWKNFDQMCNIVNQRMFGLVDKLKSRGITSEPELRLCVLVAVGRFNNKEMASLVPYGYDSLKTTKSTLANRLGVSGRKMREFLLHLAL